MVGILHDSPTYHSSADSNDILYGCCRPIVECCETINFFMERHKALKHTPEETLQGPLPAAGTEKTLDLAEVQIPAFTSKDLHCLHLNVCSRLPKTDEICVLACKGNDTILCFTETWIDSIRGTEVEIENFSIIHKDRRRRGGGGGGSIYVRLNIEFNGRADLNNDHLEAALIDILLTELILTGALYRTPDQRNFVVILLDDVNIDILNENGSLHNALLNFLKTFGLTQLINDPTRISEHSQTAVDLIMVSDKCQISHIGVIVYGITDHFLTYCTRKVRTTPMNCHNSIKSKTLRRYDIDKFKNMLKNMDRCNVMDSCDVVKALNHFQSHFLQVLDKIAPLKEVKIKLRTQHWINKDSRHYLFVSYSNKRS